MADDTLIHFMTQRLVELYAGLPTEFVPGETQGHVVEWIESQFDGWKRFSAAKWVAIFFKPPAALSAFNDLLCIQCEIIIGSKPKCLVEQRQSPTL